MTIITIGGAVTAKGFKMNLTALRHRVIKNTYTRMNMQINIFETGTMDPHDVFGKPA